jgi:hypothetical protein
MLARDINPFRFLLQHVLIMTSLNLREHPKKHGIYFVLQDLWSAQYSGTDASTSRLQAWMPPFTLVPSIPASLRMPRAFIERPPILQ